MDKKPPMTRRILDLHLRHITLGDMFGRDTHWHVQPKGDGFLLQLRFFAADVSDPYSTDSFTHQVQEQKCRKWYISQWSTLSEVVETAFKAARAAIEHELKENFRFEGEQVYNPHFDVLARKEMCEDGRFDVRD